LSRKKQKKMGGGGVKRKTFGAKLGRIIRKRGNTEKTQKDATEGRGPGGGRGGPYTAREGRQRGRKRGNKRETEGKRARGRGYFLYGSRKGRGKGEKTREAAKKRD